ncbi:hypothetical protein [Limimaricola pyoseonensis]|uniref:hypothetical protein n=1 Tax=Limimaricola pyoseonensis TaxID=521013 RepID=UPI0013F4CB6B|nr:hypothetical protein [Limimaricola pyoseonensis]
MPLLDEAAAQRVADGFDFRVGSVDQIGKDRLGIRGAAGLQGAERQLDAALEAGNFIGA